VVIGSSMIAFCGIVVSPLMAAQPVR